MFLVMFSSYFLIFILVSLSISDEKFTLSWWNLKENVNVYLDDEESEKVAAPLPQALADMMSISGDFVTVCILSSPC